MKKIKYLLLLLIVATVNINLAQKISKNIQRDLDFEYRKTITQDKTPFKIFTDSLLKGDRLEAMKFLYSYMSLADIAGYPSDFFLKNVDASLKAMEEMPWGKDIPEREFLHFVLPVRANNEQLDSSRLVFYEELKPRVEGMTIEEAILETNHWCHEKVSYKASDGRTSSPLSSVGQAIGRCGEESTFTVAALRAIGIPARQVYTPRWAHTDDNHAWVEAYANGKWYFLGACEPEPVLNLGWFNEPASRGILMNTNVIGKYDGPEEKLSSHNILTTINVTENYADIDTLKVRVLDVNGKPIGNCKVNFCIYNYAEFYPAASKLTNAAGETSIISGHGDMVIWATNGQSFGFEKGNSKNKNVVNVVLDKPADYEGSFTLNLSPAPPKNNTPYVSSQQREFNNLRLTKEDSIRNAYISTFAKEEDSSSESKHLGVNKDKLTKILLESRGNHKNILNYLEHIDPSLRETAMDILIAVTEKDRRDIPMFIIDDNLSDLNLNLNLDSVILTNYILNPRIEREPLVTYKDFFKHKFSNDTSLLFRKQPEKLVEWVIENIKLDNSWNPQNLRMNPISVWQQREANEISRDIFFVALARSLGIPAQIDPVTSNPMYIDNNGEWINAKFIENDSNKYPKGKIKIDFSPQGRIIDPLYYSQFSISRFKDGVPVQLEYEETDRVSSINEKDKDLETGKYLMLSGQRLANGSVLVNGEIFNVMPDSTLTVNLIIPQDASQIQVISNFNAENLYHDIEVDQDKSIISTTGRGYYILGLIKPLHEPSKHILNDLILAAKELQEWNGEIIMLLPEEKDVAIFDINEFKDLPQNIHFGFDIDGSIQKELISNLNLENISYPLIIIADTFNRIVYLNSGYTIGLGTQLLDVLDKL